MSEGMRAISLWQPWASLIADGRKSIETRHWPTAVRGPVAIHAAMKVDKEACREFGYDPKTIPRGAVLCVVDFSDCVRFPHPSAPPDEYGDFHEGRYGFVMQLTEVFPEPIPAKGMQGFWFWEAPAGKEG